MVSGKLQRYSYSTVNGTVGTLKQRYLMTDTTFLNINPAMLGRSFNAPQFTPWGHAPVRISGNLTIYKDQSNA
jgi:hypothetical protein